MDFFFINVACNEEWCGHSYAEPMAAGTHYETGEKYHSGRNDRLGVDEIT